MKKCSFYPPYVLYLGLKRVYILYIIIMRKCGRVFCSALSDIILSKELI